MGVTSSKPLLVTSRNSRPSDSPSIVPSSMPSPISSPRLSPIRSIPFRQSRSGPLSHEKPITQVPVGDDGADAAPAGRLAVGLRVGTLVGHHRPRRNVGADAEQGLELAAVAGLPAGEVEVQRQARKVHLQVDLDREATTERPSA